MDVKLFPLMLDTDGKTVLLAHTWPTTLDEFVFVIRDGVALSWVAIDFKEILLITPITFN